MHPVYPQCLQALVIAPTREVAIQSEQVGAARYAQHSTQHTQLLTDTQLLAHTHVRAHIHPTPPHLLTHCDFVHTITHNINININTVSRRDGSSGSGQQQQQQLVPVFLQGAPHTRTHAHALRVPVPCVRASTDGRAS